MSAPILFDQSRLKAYDGLIRLCEYAGESGEWQQNLSLIHISEPTRQYS